MIALTKREKLMKLAFYHSLTDFDLRKLDFSISAVNPLIISSILCALFMLQSYYNLSPQFLVELQTNSAYKQITGFLLISCVLYQWRLAFARSQGIKSDMITKNNHRFYGALIPLVYFIHSVEFGYAYQAVISIALLSNCIVGGCNPLSLKIKQKHYYSSWLVLHITLSVIILPLSIYHLYVVYLY